MAKHNPLKRLDSTYYETLGKGLSEHFKSGIDYIKNSRFVSYAKRTGENIDKIGEKACYEVANATSNNPTSNKWRERHKGTILSLAIGGAASTAYVALAAAVGHRPDPSIGTEYHGTEFYSWAFPLNLSDTGHGVDAVARHVILGTVQEPPPLSDYIINILNNLKENTPAYLIPIEVSAVASGLKELKNHLRKNNKNL